MHNPFWIADQPAGTETSGWLQWSPRGWDKRTHQHLNVFYLDDLKKCVRSIPAFQLRDEFFAPAFSFLFSESVLDVVIPLS